MSKKKKSKSKGRRGPALDEKVTKRVKAMMKAGKTQREIAKALKIAQSSVSRHFNIGRKAPLRAGTRKSGDMKKGKKVTKVKAKASPKKKVAQIGPSGPTLVDVPSETAVA